MKSLKNNKEREQKKKIKLQLDTISQQFYTSAKTSVGQ